VKEARASLRRRNVKTLVFVAITTLAIVSIWGWISASQQERIAELRFQAATVQVSLPASPLNALLLAMAATHDNLAPPTLVRLPWTRNNVLPAVQYALSSAMVKATEDARIEQDPIGAVAMTPDGSLIVTSTSTAPASSAAGAKPVATLKFWNRFGSPSDSLPPPLPSFEWRLMAFSPNGNLLAFGGQGLSVLDLQKKVLSGPDSFGGAQGLRNLTSIAFTEDGKYLLAGEGDGILRVFAVDGREVTKVQADYGRHLVRLPIFSRGAMNDASMMPDEVPSPEHPERYDLPPNLQTLATTSGLKGETLVATGGYEGVGRLWKLDEAKSGDAKLTLVKEFHVGVHITSVAITVRGGQVLVAVGDMSGKLQIWDQTGQSNVPYSFSDSISAIAFHPKSSLVAATGMDGTIRYLSFSGVSIAPPFHGVLRTINTLLFFPDGNRLLAGAKGGVRFLDMDMLGGSRRITAFDDFQNSSLQTQSSQTPVGQTQSSDKIVGAAFLKGGLAVAGTEAGDLYFYFRETDAVRHVPGNPGLGFHVLAANRQGTLIAAAGNHGRIHLFDPSGSKIGEMRPPADVSQAAEHLVFSDDGKTLATDYPDGRILVWDVDRRQQKTLIPRQATQDHLLHLMAFTPAGDLAAIPVSPLDNKSIPVLRLLHFQQDGSLPGIRKMTLVDPATSELQVDVTALAFRHDGKGFLTGHADGMVQHWAMDGKPVGRPIQLGKTSILWMAGDAESGRLYLADTNGIGTATDPVPSGSSAVEATASFDLPLEIKSAALSVEEDEIVTVDQSGVRIWPADWRTFLRESCERLQNHAVFTRHAKIEGVSLDVIDRALAVCQEQVKKP
jgi:WD40 repeat protein